MKFIASDNLPLAIGPYSPAVKINGIIYTSGQVPISLDGTILERDIKVQTRQALSNLRTLLEDSNSGMEKVIKISIYLENIGEQVSMENGTESSLLFGSQVRKLLFNTEDFSDLYEEFRNAIQQLTQIEKDNLFRDASLNENGEVINKADFVDFLMREIDKKVVNSNVKEYLRLTKAGEFAGSLDTNLQRQPIEQIVNSVLQNKIVN